MFHMKRILLFLLVLFFCIDVSGQENFKHVFYSLSKQEKKWIISHLFYAVETYKITKETLLITQEINKDTVLDQDPYGGQVDAFRHLYWMAKLTQKIGGKAALELGIAHEKTNYEECMVNKFSKHDLAACEMDLFNNKMGVAIGELYPKIDSDSLKCVVINMILEGKALIVYKNALGHSLDNHHQVIPDEKWQGRWKNNRMLVFSNQKWSRRIRVP